MDHTQRKQNPSKGSKFLSKGGSLVHFQAHQQPFSPARDALRRHAETKQRGFSGPMFEPTRSDQAEPVSPKVSCIGQIKHKKGKKKKEQASLETKPSVSLTNAVKEKRTTGSYSFFKIFKRSSSDITDAASAKRRYPIAKPPQSLGEIKKFSSGRGTLATFDWHGNEETDSDEELSNPNPITTPGAALEFKPRKEINLWKRRTTTPPTPLLLR